MPDTPDLIISPKAFDAAVFDLDGVVTRTVQVHVNAWKRLFDEFLLQHPSGEGEDLSPFDQERDYRRYLDGRPRYQGVRHFLAARRIDLPLGTPDDPADRNTICGLGNRKNTFFRRILEEEGIDVYGCAVALVHQLRAAGIKTAVVSASKNCKLILASAGIQDLFDASLSGLDAERLDLDAKPDPDTVLEVCRRLSVHSERTVLFEDALAGVKAGKRGGFGLIVGVDHGNQSELLIEHGASIVVDDLCDIRVDGGGLDDRHVPGEREPAEAIAVLLKGRSPALVLDYDGTLTAENERPGGMISGAAKRALFDAAERFPVAILSGRSLDELHAIADIPRVFYAASYGLDIAGPGLRLQHPFATETLPALDAAGKRLQTQIEKIQGARIERERFGIVVRYELASDNDVPRIEALIDEVNRSLPQLRKTVGSRTLALRPDMDWDKGHALRWLLLALDLEGAGVLPIYVGDDPADEDAFQALRTTGVGVLVSQRAHPSMAEFRVEGPQQVVDLIRALTRAHETLAPGERMPT